MESLASTPGTHSVWLGSVCQFDLLGSACYLRACPVLGAILLVRPPQARRAVLAVEGFRSVCLAMQVVYSRQKLGVLSGATLPSGSRKSLAGCRTVGQVQAPLARSPGQAFAPAMATLFGRRHGLLRIH